MNMVALDDSSDKFEFYRFALNGQELEFAWVNDDILENFEPQSSEELVRKFQSMYKNKDFFAGSSILKKKLN